MNSAFKLAIILTFLAIVAAPFSLFASVMMLLFALGLVIGG